MPARLTGPLLLLAALGLALGCDGPGMGWPATDQIDADVTRIQELASARVAAGEPAPKGPSAMAAVTAPAPTTPPPAAPDEPEPEAFVPDAARGAQAYANFCASCHGAEGKGDGVAGVNLDPKPTDHTDGGYMNPLSDDHLFKVVSEGGPAVGKSAQMAAWGAALGEDKTWDVVAYMRSIAEPAYDGAAP